MILENAYADISSGTRSLHSGLRPYLHPYFEGASSEGAGDSAHMRRKSPEPPLLDNATGSKISFAGSA